MIARWNTLRRATSAALAVLFLSETAGCYSWKAVPVPAPRAPRPAESTHFRITTTHATALELRAVHFRNDTLLGVPTESGGPEMGVATQDITAVQQQVTNGTLTALAIVAGITGVILAASAIGGGSSPAAPPPPPPAPIGLGSCPQVSSWDGTNWILDSGTFGGAITPALARTDLDNLLFARAFKGSLQFLMTDTANETEHVDAFAVVAVDHPQGTSVAPDARENGTFHLIRELSAPRAARDFMGRDALDQVRAPDSRVWESRLDGRDPANPAQLRDGLELTFMRPAIDRALLVIDGQNTPWAASLVQEMVQAYGRETAKWYDPATAVAASQPILRAQRDEGFLAASVWDGSAWRPVGQIFEAGPEVAKRQVLEIDLAGVTGAQIHVRLESAPVFWDIDYVALGPAVDLPVVVRELPTVAVISKRFPDARTRLATIDSTYLDMERGDSVWITVHDTVATPPAGMLRSYLARTTGWYRVHGHDDAPPDVATLTAFAQGPHGPARVAVMRLNQLLAALDREARNATPR